MRAAREWAVVHLVEGETFVARFRYKDQATRWLGRLHQLGAASEGAGLALYRNPDDGTEPVRTWGVFPKETNW
jgi:hypothetical protein